jgi:hypothetical protein
MIHDAQLDYYAKRLATCSSDRTIRVYDVSGEQQQELAQLRGHDGSVWQVAWAHPRFGVILASCSYDSKVLLFRETSPNTFEQVGFRPPFDAFPSIPFFVFLPFLHLDAFPSFSFFAALPSFISPPSFSSIFLPSSSPTSIFLHLHRPPPSSSAIFLHSFITPPSFISYLP